MTKKIILALLLTLISLPIFSQNIASNFSLKDIDTYWESSIKSNPNYWIPKVRLWGSSTYLADSTNYLTLNKGFYAFDSIKAGAWIFAGANKQGGLYLDTNKKGEVSFTGQSMYLYNRKENGWIYFYSGEKNSGFSFNKFSGGATSEIASIDTIYGFRQFAGNIQIDQSMNPTGQIKLPSDTATDYDSDNVVTINRQSGKFKTKSLTTAAGGGYSIQLSNSLVTATTKVIALVQYGYGTNTTAPCIVADVVVGSGTATFSIYNISGSSLNGTVGVSYIIFN